MLLKKRIIKQQSKNDEKYRKAGSFSAKNTAFETPAETLNVTEGDNNKSLHRGDLESSSSAVETSSLELKIQTNSPSKKQHLSDQELFSQTPSTDRESLLQTPQKPKYDPTSCSFTPQKLASLVSSNDS